MLVPIRGKCEAGESPALSRNCDATLVAEPGRQPVSMFTLAFEERHGHSQHKWLYFCSGLGSGQEFFCVLNVPGRRRVPVIVLLPSCAMKGVHAMSNAWSRKVFTILALGILAGMLAAACTTQEDDAATDDQADDQIEAVDDQATEPDDEATDDAVIDEDHDGAADDEDLVYDATDDDEMAETEDAADDEVVDDESAEYPVTVTRTDNVELTIEERPEQIVSLSPGATETFYAIGAGDQLAAVDMFSDYPPEATELTQLDAYQPEPEAIVELDPDLVFVVFDADGIVSTLDDLDIPVLYLDAPTSLDGLMDDIETLGDVTGNQDEAAELVASLQDRIDEVTANVPDDEESLSVYHELDDQLFSVSPDSFVGDVYTTLGLENIADGAMGEYPQLSEEIILEEDPDVIVAPTHGQPEGERADEISERPGWDVISAVQEDRIYEIDGDLISRPGPRVVDALVQLAEMIYPEAFASIHGNATAINDHAAISLAW